MSCKLMFFFFISLKEELFESHSNILLFTLYFVYFKDMLNFHRHYFIRWVRDSTGSVSVLCAETQKDVSSCMTD